MKKIVTVKVAEIRVLFQSFTDDGLNRPKQSRSEKKARKVRLLAE